MYAEVLDTRVGQSMGEFGDVLSLAGVMWGQWESIGNSVKCVECAEGVDV